METLYLKKQSNLGNNSILKRYSGQDQREKRNHQLENKYLKPKISRGCCKNRIFQNGKQQKIETKTQKLSKLNMMLIGQNLFQMNKKEIQETKKESHFKSKRFSIYQSILSYHVLYNFRIFNIFVENIAEKSIFTHKFCSNMIENESFCIKSSQKKNYIPLLIKKFLNSTLKKKECANQTLVSKKLIKRNFKIILNESKRKHINLKNIKNLNLYLKSNSSLNKEQLLGGGGCCSTTKFNAIQQTDEIQNYNQQNKEFESMHKKWTHEETIRQSIEENNQLTAQKKMLQQCIVDQIIQSTHEINIYQSEIQDIFETYLMLEVTRNSNKSDQVQEQFETILNNVKSIESFEQDYPIMELVFYADMLTNLNKFNHKFDESQQKEILNIKEFINVIIKFNKNRDFSTITQRLKDIKQNINIFDKKKELFPLKYSVEIWLRKIQQFGEQFRKISEEVEILFYMKIFFEINQIQSQQDQIILTLIRINFILERFIKQKSQQSNKQQIYQEFNNALMKSNIDEFLSEIMQKSDKFTNSLFLIFSIENQYYRYITLSILLNFNSIYTIAFQNQKHQEYLLDFLCNKYLTEQELAIRVIFEKSNEFVQYFNQNIKIENFKEKMIKFDTQRKSKLQPHVKSLEKYERSIRSFEDIIELIADNAIQKWERDIKKRQKLNIAQKDDVLLEVRDLYINQMITYLNGNPIFKKSEQNNGLVLSHIQNALKDIFKLFLNYDQKMKQCGENNNSENNFQNLSNQCKVLGILAEGGTGKSMLMKKIETELIQKLTKLKIETENEIETRNYLPIMVKCNSLDPKNPSLDEYLKLQGINEEIIQNLKQNERNKLILFDGYDEYSGDYFNVYSTLKMNQWKNTKIIISTRKEKLSDSDACIYFGIQNEQGEIDEMSLILVRLEEFTSKDIDDYAERYFKKERKTDQIKLVEKDKQNLRDCLVNVELEKLLHLPINLYLFTRMLVNLDDKGIQDLKSNVSDQIGIQEIFFSDQFEREAQSFIDAHVTSFDLMRDKNFISSIKNCYFEYFQTVAMMMFKHRGVVQSNYLQVERQSINFNILQSVTQVLLNPQIISLKDKIQNYINSKIITRVKSEEQQNFNQPSDNLKKFIEFKHKSLYEYFVARAMKFDFDTHEENIYKLKMEELEQFKINQKCIMNIGENKSEQQILIKLYKLMQTEIESEEFFENYHENLIEKNNRYIQYIKRSQISTSSEFSKIDVGASNLISSLFISKFSYSKLCLSLCSFSKAYICAPKSQDINFDRCNLQYAFLQNSNINFDSCNIQQASFYSYSKIFDTDDKYSFEKVLCGENNLLFSISKSGFINAFKITYQNIEVFMSKQLSQTPLSNMKFANDNHLLVSSKSTLFYINSNTFEIIQTHKFKQPISNISLIENDIGVVLLDETILKGTFKDGFQQLNNIGAVSGSIYNQNNPVLVTYYKQSITILNTQNFELIKTIKAHDHDISSVAFSSDGRLLATCSTDKTCKIWNAEKDYELINTIQDDEKMISVSFSTNGKYLATSCYGNTCKIWNVQKDFDLINTVKGYILSFSADGKNLATGSGDKSCKIWNAEKDFEFINTIQGHDLRISSVAISADGKYIATGSEDKTCKIWNVQKGFKLIITIQGHTHKIISVAFSQDGKYLATGSYDNTCKIWNAEKEFELLNTIEGHTDEITNIAFSADGMYLATASYDDTCKIWNVEKGFVLFKIIEDKKRIDSVVFSADGKYLATSSKDSCKIWNVEQGFENTNTTESQSDWIRSVTFSPEGKYLVAGDINGICKTWNVEKDFKLINTIQAHTRDIKSVDFSADGKYLATGSSDEECKLWNVEKGFQLINTIQLKGYRINQVAFFADRNQLVTVMDDISFKIWNIEKGFERINTIQGHTSWITSIALSSDGKYLATGSDDNTFKIWNAKKDFELIYAPLGLIDHVMSVAFSVDGKYFVTGLFNQTFQIWNAQKSFEHINTIGGYYNVHFSADGKYLATFSKTITILNVEKDFENIMTIEEHTDYVYSVAFSANGKYLASGSKDKTCKIWNIEKGFELINTIEEHTNDVASVAFSPDVKYLASGSRDTTCKIWNVEKDFEFINTLQGHSYMVKCVTFSADGKYLATGSLDYTCKVWNVQKNFELIQTLQGFTNTISSVVFSEDGKFLMTGSYDKTCKIWNVKKDFELMYVL